MSGGGSDDAYPVDAPGWAAIDRAFARLYPGQVPHQFASPNPYDLDGTTPLPAVSVWEGGNPAHWHHVSHGLSELFEKSSNNPDISGFGFELTLRLPRGDEDVPPAWGVRLIQALGHYVLSGHGLLDTGHVVDLGGSIRPDGHSPLTGVMLVPDPDLGKIETPHGSLLFLQLVGLMPNELEVVKDWELPRKVGLVNEIDRLAITDPNRVSWRDDERTAPIFRRYELNVMLE